MHVQIFLLNKILTFNKIFVEASHFVKDVLKWPLSTGTH